jgi:hypothetical protein
VTLGVGDLQALAHKYRTLVALRARRDAGGAAEAAAAGAPPEPWMAWIDGYHRLMRAAFEIRRRQRSPEEVAALDAPEGPAAAEMDPAFVQAVVKPPLGRIGIVVLRRLAVLFDVPARDIAAALFPLRRPSPYKL